MESWEKCSSKDRVQESNFQLARRRTFLNIDLDVLSNNVRIIKDLCSSHTEIIAVVKGNAYGHGSVEISRHLTRLGVRHFAVASPWEGTELRRGGIEGFIQVLGNASEEDIPDLIEFDLVPTVCSLEFLQVWAEETKAAEHYCHGYFGAFEDEECGRRVVIKVDTGMSRNGCQPQHLDTLVNYCDEQGIGIHSIMTHFSCAWDNPEFTRQQLDTFLRVAVPYRQRGIKLHVANTAATLRGYGTDLDFVRPGIALYGLPPDTAPTAIDMYSSLGLKPILSWMTKPNLVKVMHEGQTVGYDNTYRCEEGERIATIALGYADGYNRLLSGKGVLTTTKGTPCPIVGRVSMDAISVRLPDKEEEICDTLYVIKDDFTSANSIVSLAKQLGTITYEIATSLAARLARVYVHNGTAHVGKRFS